MEFTEEVWETCKYKKAFDTAIANCLDPSKFIESPEIRRKRKHLSFEDYQKFSPKQKRAEDRLRAEYQKRTVQDRRAAIYHNVVSPLYWLAKVGNSDTGDVRFIKLRKQKNTKRRQSTYAEGPEVVKFWSQIKSPSSSFSCNPRIDGNAEKWVDGIRDLSNYIGICQRSLRARLRPIRIAVLDTGCDRSLKDYI